MKLRRTTLTVAAALAAVGVAASPAYAFDCIRVSSSPQGLQQSSAHGQWYTVTLDGLLQQAGITDSTQVACVEQAWTSLGEPTTFAIGTGVAGAKGAQQSGHLQVDFFELAKNAPVAVMTDGKGIDHLDDVIAQVAGQCGLQPPA